MNTGLEGIESPITANDSEQWEECKITIFSPTENRVVSYNKSRKRNNTGEKTEKKATSTTTKRGTGEPTEQDEEDKVNRNKEGVYKYLMANPWEYTVFFYDITKKDFGVFSGAVREKCRTKGYKPQYIHVPIDVKGGFVVVSVVSGVPVELLQALDFCKCHILPYGSHHAKTIREQIQYRRDERGFIHSQKLREPEVIIIKKPRCREGDITTDLYAVSTFSSTESAIHYAETGERMGRTEESFDAFKSKTETLMKKEQWFKYIPLNMFFDKHDRNVQKTMQNIYFYESRTDDRDITIAGRTEKTKDTVLLASDKESGYILRELVNGEDYVFDTFQTVYIISRKADNMVFYVGVAYDPLNRYCDHFGINDFNKDAPNELEALIGWGVGTYGKGKKNEKENTSPFYKLVIEKNWNFDDFYITFVLLDKYFDGEKWASYVPMQRSKHKPSDEDSKYIREAERAEAMLQTYFLEMDAMGFEGFKVYKKEDGTTLLENGVMDKFKKDMTVREAYKDSYESMHFKHGQHPLYTVLKKDNVCSLREMFELLFKREMEYWTKMALITGDTEKVKNALKFAEKVWKRKAEMLGFQYKGAVEP